MRARLGGDYVSFAAPTGIFPMDRLFGARVFCAAGESYPACHTGILVIVFVAAATGRPSKGPMTMSNITTQDGTEIFYKD